ncbi:MAG: NBR1-Ig-like domain-containing protein [Anaerolineales bacterium]|nr:NBR1-Ig-like domain-containing protein [Anaerolineales bacterium]
MFRVQLRSGFISLAMIFLASGCAPVATPTAFRPPTQIPPTKPLPTVTSIPLIYTIAPTLTLAPTAAGPCSNDLQFINDATIDDNTIVLPNSSIDKQWLVQNTGTCNWDATYRLKWIGGDPLGAVQEQALFPARAGTQAILHILFIAPSSAGTYESSWQAISPDGNLFGDPIYIKVAVVP